MQFLTKFIANFFPQKWDFLSKFFVSKEQGVGRCHFRCSRAISSHRFVPKWRNQLPASLCFHLLFSVTSFHKCFPLAVQLQAAAEKCDSMCMCSYWYTELYKNHIPLRSEFLKATSEIHKFRPKFWEKKNQYISYLHMKPQLKKKSFLMILFSLPRWLKQLLFLSLGGEWACLF